MDSKVTLTAMQDFNNLFFLPFCVGNCTLTALLDSGASRSFVSPRAVRALTGLLQPIETQTLSVTLPNGENIKTTAAYTLKIRIENFDLEVTLFEVKM